MDFSEQLRLMIDLLSTACLSDSPITAPTVGNTNNLKSDLSHPALLSREANVYVVDFSRRGREVK